MKAFVHINTCTQMFITVLCVIVKYYKQFQWPLSCEWINKLCYIHTKAHCSATERNKLFIYTTTRTNRNILILGEKSNTRKKVHTVRFHLYLLENATLVTESISLVVWRQNWGPGERRIKEGLERGLRKLFGVMDMFTILTVMMV